MIRRLILSLVALAFSASAAEVLELSAIEREIDLERRSRLALEYARARVDSIVEAYVEAEPERAQEILADIVTAIEISQEALAETGKHPRAKPKHFKRAEIETRKLVRDLEGAKKKLTYDERQDLDPTIARIEEINQELLMGIMQKK